MMEGVTIRFAKVVDSRCPKQVMCVRAGEAKVWVEIYKGGKYISKKEIQFSASGFISAEMAQLFNSENLIVSGLALSPYPEVPNGLIEKDYTLNVSVKWIE